MRIRSVIPGAAAVVLTVVVCAACGGGKSSSGTTTQSAAKQTFCSDVSTFKGHANDLKNVDASTETLSGLKTSAKDLVNSGKAVVTSGKHLASVNASELGSGLRDLTTAVKNIPNAGSIQQGLEGVQTAAKSVSQTWSSLAQSAGCNSSSS